MSNLFLLPKVQIATVQFGGSNNFSTTPNNAGAAINIGIGGNIFSNNTSSINTTGINNLGIGGNIFVNNITGTNNIGIGGNIFGSHIVGNYNTAIGGNVFPSNVTGNYNTGIGINSGNSILGSYNTMVGANTGQSDKDINTYNYSTALGYGAIVNSNNQLMLGTTAERVVIPSMTISSNSTTGALVVAGGVGITGNTYVTGNVVVIGNIYTNMLYVGSITAGSSSFTALSAGSITSGSLSVGTGTVTAGNIFCGTSVSIGGTLITQGLIYENINTCTQSVNTLSFSYTTGGLWTVGTMITANATLSVTNIPTDTSKSYTFSVCYQQTATRYYIATVQIQNTNNVYITNSGSSGFVAPLFNGGTPSLSGTTNCIIVQQFTIIYVGSSNRVISSVSCYS